MMSDAFDPYYIWLGIPPKDQPANHYRLLGLQDFEENTDVIDAAANRQMTYLREMATGPHRKESQQLLNEIAGARRCLLSPERKQEYDERMQAERAVTDPVQLSDPPMPFIDTGSPPTVDHSAAAPPEVVVHVDSVSSGRNSGKVKERRHSKRPAEPVASPSPAAPESDLPVRKPVPLQWIITGASVVIVAIIIFVILNRPDSETNAPEATSTTTKLDGSGAAVVTKTSSGRGKKSSKSANQNRAQDDDGRSLFDLVPDTEVIDSEEQNTGGKQQKQ